MSEQARARAAASSLAAARAGEKIAIRRILFDELRALCADLDLHEGDVVRCRTGASSRMSLETAGGRVVLLERDWARFIQVDPLSAEGRCTC